MITTLPGFEWRPGATGIFEGIPSEQYHRAVSGLSRSVAEKIVFQSLAHAKEAIDHPQPPTDAMKMGTLVHCGVLEPDRLAASYSVKPRVNPLDPDDKFHGAKKWCKEWLARPEHVNPISEDDERNLLGCVNALHDNGTLGAMLRTGHPETSVFVEDQGIILKCRPDLMATHKDGREWILDIKKCQNCAKPVFQAQSRSAHREFQEAWYRYVLGKAGVKVDEFVFAGVEEEAPYGVGLFRIADEIVNRAYPLVIEAIRLWKEALQTGVFPNYTDQIQEMDWIIRKPTGEFQ